jgi:glycosyltransferase involved in cell wall biosynthesis
VICISNFTKQEFLKYAEENDLYNIEFPSVVSIPLPYQYRNKKRIKSKENQNTKIKILLPGTIEPRKQQMLLIKLFNRFITQNPEIDVELITFGSVLQIYQEEMNQQIQLSKGKIIYLGIIDNETLFDLYKNSSFLCFISKYEGYGFPISESLWHGLPVLTSNFGSMAEVASCGGCYCIDTTNENEIYEALNHLIKNPIFIEKLKKEIDDAILTNWNFYAEKVYGEIVKELK